jgi:hypothetical protein
MHDISTVASTWHLILIVSRKITRIGLNANSLRFEELQRRLAPIPACYISIRNFAGADPKLHPG